MWTRDKSYTQDSAAVFGHELLRVHGFRQACPVLGCQGWARHVGISSNMGSAIPLWLPAEKGQDKGRPHACPHLQVKERTDDGLRYFGARIEFRQTADAEPVSLYSVDLLASVIPAMKETGERLSRAQRDLRTRLKKKWTGEWQWAQVESSELASLKVAVDQSKAKSVFWASWGMSEASRPRRPIAAIMCSRSWLASPRWSPS